MGSIGFWISSKSVQYNHHCWHLIDYSSIIEIPISHRLKQTAFMTSIRPTSKINDDCEELSLQTMTLC